MTNKVIWMKKSKVFTQINQLKNILFLFRKNETYFIHKKIVLNKLIEKEYSISFNADYINFINEITLKQAIYIY